MREYPTVGICWCCVNKKDINTNWLWWKFHLLRSKNKYNFAEEIDPCWNPSHFLLLTSSSLYRSCGSTLVWVPSAHATWIVPSVLTQRTCMWSKMWENVSTNCYHLKQFLNSQPLYWAKIHLLIYIHFPWIYCLRNPSTCYCISFSYNSTTLVPNGKLLNFSFNLNFAVHKCWKIKSHIPYTWPHVIAMCTTSLILMLLSD